ncbi:MAG: 30S ribosomal protein S4 [Patescibacteria group bacterium]|nr:30S ribosomal protein S4 [Patescibacteria group bacterium]MDD5715075.1 30S ribosomal protein S4 [Patescibacteria group bacterium]
MGRYLGPKHKLCRQFGIRLCDSPKCPAVKRPYRPGMHGPKKSQRLSEYGLQLREKQKAKFLYGLQEKTFRNYIIKAKHSKGDAGQNVMLLLETRLDNTLYRIGIAKTRRAARQIVNHGHILVNKRTIDIPSYHVKAGNVISINESSLKKPFFSDSLKSIDKKRIPSWISVSNESGNLKATITGKPTENELQQGFDTAIIIEFYSR